MNRKTKVDATPNAGFQNPFEATGLKERGVAQAKTVTGLGCLGTWILENYFLTKIDFMTVFELKEMLEGVDDNTEVLIPLNAGDGFDGMFFSPCPEESGIGEMGIADGDEEDLKEMELLGKQTTKKEFLLVPHGFFEIVEDEIDPELN